MQLLEVPEVLAAVQCQLEGKNAPLRLSVLDVTYAAPLGGALGVIVQCSEETADEGSCAADIDPEPPVSAEIETSADTRMVPR